jgi:glycosyltransferase involved in cell wall biosynthesis
MRVFWISNAPFTKTGYGVQSNIFLPILQEMGHEVACLSYYGLEGAVINMNGVTLYPKGHHPYGMDVLPVYAKNFNSDLIISLMDAWVFQPSQTGGIPWIPYYPVDHEPIPEKVRTAIMQGLGRIAMSKFGVRQTNLAGLDCLYVPHAVNTALYKPIDKYEARERLKLPKDAFIVGTVAMNKGIPSRKNFQQLLEAFANFKKKHKDAFYYLHTEQLGIDNQSFNIPEYCNMLGLENGKDYLLPDPTQKTLGFPENWMANMYSALDVHMLVSTGEGFGIPIIEAQACGCPVIVGGWTAMEELCFSGHVVDKKDAMRFLTGIASYQWIPQPRAIERKLHLEYNKPSSRELAVEKAQEYSIENVSEKYFKPAMHAIEEEITAWKSRWNTAAEEFK